MHHQEGRLHAVCEGDPGQVPEHQHEAKTIMHYVHGGQHGLLFKHNSSWHEGDLICYLICLSDGVNLNNKITLIDISVDATELAKRLFFIRRPWTDVVKHGGY